MLCAEAPGGVPSVPGFLCAGRLRVPEASATEDGIRKWAFGFLVWKQEQRIKLGAAELPDAKASPALGQKAFLKPSTLAPLARPRVMAWTRPASRSVHRPPISFLGWLVGSRAVCLSVLQFGSRVNRPSTDWRTCPNHTKVQTTQTLAPTGLGAQSWLYLSPEASLCLAID